MVGELPAELGSESFELEGVNSGVRGRRGDDEGRA